MSNTGLIFLIVIAILWEAVWKSIGLWRAGRNNQLGWFIFMLILNTAGILEILYLLFFQKDENYPKQEQERVYQMAEAVEEQQQEVIVEPEKIEEKPKRPKKYNTSKKKSAAKKTKAKSKAKSKTTRTKKSQPRSKRTKPSA